MQEVIQNILKRTSVLFLFLGILLLLVAAASGISLNTFSLNISDSIGRITIGIAGFILVGLGIYVELGERFNKIPNSTKEFKVTEFSSRKEYTEYRMRQLRKAKKIDDVTWRFKDVNKQPHTGGDSILRKEQIDLISQIAKKPDVVWRGVAVFTSVEHLERELPLISEIENTGYNFGVYEINPQTSPPLSGFMIIDDRELFIAYPPKSIMLTIQHPSVVKLFSEYFDDIWQSAQKVKLGNKIDFQKLHQIENDLKSKSLLI
jgi:hypothetical protein